MLFVYIHENTYYITLSQIHTYPDWIKHAKHNHDAYMRYQRYDIGDNIVIVIQLEYKMHVYDNYSRTLGDAYKIHIEYEDYVVPPDMNITLPDIERCVDQFIYGSTKPALS